MGASEGGPSSGGGGGESRGGGRGAGRRGRHAERQAGVGRTDAIGVLEGPHHDGVGGPGTGAEGSVTAARATSSTALARRIAGVGATILRKGGEGWEGRGVSARRVGDGRASHQGVDSRDREGRRVRGEGETNLAVRRSRSITRTVRTSRAPRRRENASARAAVCPIDEARALPVFAPEICGASAQRVDADANRDALEQRGVCPRNLERIREGATPEVNKRTPSGVEGGRPSSGRRARHWTARGGDDVTAICRLSSVLPFFNM